MSDVDPSTSVKRLRGRPKGAKSKQSEELTSILETVLRVCPDAKQADIAEELSKFKLKGLPTKKTLKNRLSQTSRDLKQREARISAAAIPASVLPLTPGARQVAAALAHAYASSWFGARPVFS
jgi:hypothetical protein